MANIDMPPPIKGVSLALDPSKQIPLTSGHMNNCRAICTLEQWIRICQRPGLDKVFTQQIGGGIYPIIAICVITTVD